MAKSSSIAFENPRSYHEFGGKISRQTSLCVKMMKSQGEN